MQSNNLLTQHDLPSSEFRRDLNSHGIVVIHEFLSDPGCTVISEQGKQGETTKKKGRTYVSGLSMRNQLSSVAGSVVQSSSLQYRM